MTIDESFELFKSLKDEFETLKDSSITETDTRCKILDKFLIDLLGWKEENIKREEYLKDYGYYDYLISNGLSSFVVEAKRTLNPLKLPKGRKRVKLSTLLSDPTNNEVVVQIRSYIIEKGLTHGVISNGHQFVIARFVNSDGTDWRNNSAILFNGIDAVTNRFIEFYELLSEEYIRRNGRIEIIEDISCDKKLIGLSRLRRKNEKLVRNELSDKLIKVIDIIFREIERTSDLEGLDTLKECYVFNSDVKKHQSEMSLMFLDSPPKFDEKVFGIRNTENTQNAIEEKLLDSNFTLPSPIVIIGGKGAGKTTFIKYFFQVSIKTKTRKKIPSIYLDFRSIYSHLSEPSKIYEIIIDNLHKDHTDLKLNDYSILKRIYKKEIDQKINGGLWTIFKEKPEELELKINAFLEAKIANPETQLIAISEYLINPCHKRLCIIFDNVDQLDFDIQKNAFLFAQSVHLKLKCLIIISLREGYYYQWKDRLLGDGHKVFTHGGADKQTQKLEAENRRLKEIIGDLTIELKKNDF